jgi:hypothetical protein
MIDVAAVRNLPGAPALGPDGEKIGTIGQIFVDQVSNAPSWATIRTGLFGRLESFVPLDGATFDGEELRLGFEKSVIRDAPRIDTDVALSPADETALFEYYGMGNTTPPTTEAREADELRLRKYVVTDFESVVVPVSHEEVSVEPEPRVRGAHVADPETDARPGDAERVETDQRPEVIPDTMGGADEVDRA